MKNGPWKATKGEVWPPSATGEGWKINFGKGLFHGGSHDENEWHEVMLDNLPYPIYCKMGRTSKGEVVCTGFHVEAEGREITGNHFRLIPMSQLITTIAGHASRLGIEPIKKGEPVKAKRGPKGQSREFFLDVAKRHRKLVAQGERSPAKVIASEMYASVSTVSRWLARCRAMGLKLDGDSNGSSPKAP